MEKEELDLSNKKSTEEQIISILKEAEIGAKVADRCRRHGVSNDTG